MFAVGVFDNLAQKIPLDLKADGDVAQNLAEAGMVLLANKHQTLPLSPTVKSIAVIGGHADLGVISGGGSSQVAPPGGPALAIPQGSEAFWDIKFTSALYQPSSPYRALQGALPKSQIHFDSGAYISSAVAQAKRSQVAIVFATQWMGESRDAADISLPNGQDALIAAVAKANPHTIVVLETGGPVLMPWRDKVAAVVEAWYPGARGGEALARVLTGAVNPSGRLPVSFPNSLNELPRRRLPGAMVPAGQGFAVDYSEGADVGYRWFSRRHKPVLFPFGYGLSYTRFTYSHLVVRGNMTASMSVTNVGKQRGLATPQIYVTGGPELRAERLIGWGQVALNPGEIGIVTVTLDKRLLAHWVTKAHNWHIGAGVYRIKAGDSAATLSDGVTIRLTDETLPP
jgi:beta-glucosidase